MRLSITVTTLSNILLIASTRIAAGQVAEGSSLRRNLVTDRPVAEWPVDENGVAHLKVIEDNLCIDSEDQGIATYGAYLQAALNDWSKSDVLEIQTVQMHSSNDSKCDSSPVAYEGYINVVHDNEPWHQWIGLTSWEVDANDMVTAVLVRFNDYFLSNGDREAYTSNPQTRQMAFCHEIGHAVGLPHQDEDEQNMNTGSCMDYTAHPEGGRGYGPNALHPNDVDFEKLSAVYGNQIGLRRKRATRRKMMNKKELDEQNLNYFGELVKESAREGMVRRHYQKFNEQTNGYTVTFTVGY